MWFIRDTIIAHYYFTNSLFTNSLHHTPYTYNKYLKFSDAELYHEIAN